MALSPSPVNVKYRQLALLTKEVERLVADMPLDNDIWTAKDLEERDNLELARNRLMDILPDAMERVPADDDAKQVLYIPWVDGPSDGQLYHFTKLLNVGRLHADAQAAVEAMKARSHLTYRADPCTEKQYFGHGFNTMAVLAIPVGSLVQTTGQGDGAENVPVVYAMCDSKGVTRLVN